jgi:Ca2+-binding EF-hand superfamily protein
MEQVTYAQSSDKSDKAARNREMYQQLDRNKNGHLEPEEIPEHSRDYIRRAAEKRSLNPNQPLPIETLAQDRERKPEEKKKEANATLPTSVPQAAGFAVPLETTNPAVPATIAPGFNVPLTAPGSNLEDYYDQKILDHMYGNVLNKYDRNKNRMLDYPQETNEGSWTPPIADSDTNKDGHVDVPELLERYAKKFGLPKLTEPRKNIVRTNGENKPAVATAENSKSASAGDREKLREYAQGLLNRYDRNKSGHLERPEWSEMKSDYHSADVNKDDIITLDELMVKLAGFGTSSSSSSPVSAAASSSYSAKTTPPSTTRKWWQQVNSSANSKTPEKKTYRFLTPTERLPKGLPDWFARNDANGDGQVMMSEYAATWSESVTAEFKKYDLDNDGMITPEECLAVEKLKKK